MMDIAYNAHATRRKNRSTTNLNHLSLAPLTTKLPLNDPNELPDPLSAPIRSTSYLQGKSAPTTPRLLSRSPAPSRSESRARGSSMPRAAALPKSKSAVHLGPSNGRRTPGTASPSARKRKDDIISARDSSDTDWLLRAGALISTETREFKGQSWLVSRESSTSLTGLKDPEEEAIDQELARAREMASRNASRRGSLAALYDENGSSPPHSRYGSRSQVMTPAERRSMDGYFQYAGADEGDYITGPDFVNLDEKLESLELEDTSMEDEAYVRRLVKRGQVSSWFGNVWGFQLFSVEENENEEESEGEVEELVPERRRSSVRQFERAPALAEERMPPPKADEGGWQDAAWLLSVASKVLL